MDIKVFKLAKLFQIELFVDEVDINIEISISLMCPHDTGMGVGNVDTAWGYSIDTRIRIGSYSDEGQKYMRQNPLSFVVAKSGTLSIATKYSS